MQILAMAPHRHDVRFFQLFVLATFATLVFIGPAADRLEPASSAHGTSVIPALPQAGRIFIVNTTNDAVDVNPGDGLCDTDINTPGQQCSLRAAIAEANASPGDDAIRFELPPSDPGCHLITGQCVIPFSTALPDISTNIEFDGPGAKLFQILPSGVRAFRVTTFGTVSFNGITINGGFAAGTGVGGNILNLNGGTVNINNSDLVQGIANAGGLIYKNTNRTRDDTTSV